jgi:hypothetical protein
MVKSPYKEENVERASEKCKYSEVLVSDSEVKPRARFP